MKATVVADDSGRIVGMLIRRPELTPTGNGPTHVELVGSLGRIVHEIELPVHVQDDKAIRALPQTHRVVLNGVVASLVAI